MDYQFLKTETKDNVLIITMHDPPTRNALGMEMANELMEELDRFEDNPDQRVLLLTGTEPSFCSGANVRGFGQRIQERETGDETGNEAGLPWGKMEAQYAHRQPKV